MIAYIKALLLQLFAVTDDDITPPQICPMNEGDQLCIHRSANDAARLLAADKLGYRLTLEVIEKCHYQADYDHYSVEKK